MDTDKKRQQYEENLNSTEGSNKSSLSTQANSFNEINTNISDYSFDDILNILEIQLDSFKTYEAFQKETNEKINNYIAIFENLENYKLVDFFNKIKKFLFGTSEDNRNITEAQKLLAGDLNEQKVYRDTVTKLLTVDSRFRTNYKGTLSTDYSINLPYMINNVTELRLSDVEFPATFYPFQENFENNYIWLKYTFTYDTDTTNNISRYIYFYVTPANYYQSNLLEDMQAVIDAENVPLTITHNLNFDNDGGIGNGTGTITFEYTGDSDNSVVINDLELNFNASRILNSDSNYNVSHFIESGDPKIDKYYNAESPINYRQRMGWMLGFRESLYTGSTSHTSEGQLDVIGPRYIYLLVNDFNTSSNVNFFSNNETNLLADDILGRISLKTYAFSVQSQNDFVVYGEPRYFFGLVNIDKLQIKVIDEYGRTLDLNGMDFSFTIQMTVKYNISTGS
uniref:Uncharacterized protein n=1 Tax=viral metagenome TaxID=1070528 RepID=A0A6C0L063_9ZZZZ|tara:strand:+ start:6839 stop:8194 length:1356 start_codon:yes stop_codon:yes gene_type:complete